MYIGYNLLFLKHLSRLLSIRGGYKIPKIKNVKKAKVGRTKQYFKSFMLDLLLP
jgi:hypothetical protein